MVSVHKVWIEVDDDEVGSVGLFNGRKDSLDAGLGGKAEWSLRQTEARRTHPDLPWRLFSRKVKRAASLICKSGGSLKEQGRLPDAGLAAEEHRGPLCEASANRAVQFGDAGGQPTQRLVGGGEAFDDGRFCPAFRL